MTHGIDTTEFHTHFHQETAAILRRRLLWFIAIWGGLGLLGYALSLYVILANAELASLIPQGLSRAGVVLLGLIWILFYIAALIAVFEGRIGSRGVIRISMGLIVLDGLYAVALRAIDPSLMINMWYFVIAHFVACCVFPWTLRQAVVPIALVLTASSLSHVLIEGDTIGGTFALGAFVLVFNLPALGISSFRHNQRLSKSTNRFLSSRYGKLRQELAYARQVHEALFPAPVMQGAVRFAYRYEPMRQIGGDYLHTHHTVDRETGVEAFSAVIVDVTGHGIPAALTVNRLHGEIDLRFAEEPDIEPGRAAQTPQPIHQPHALETLDLRDGAVHPRLSPIATASSTRRGGIPPRSSGAWTPRSGISSPRPSCSARQGGPHSTPGSGRSSSTPATR